MSSNNLSTLNLPITNTLDRPDVSNIGFVIPGYKSYIAITQEQKDKAYRLRHEVYSKELKWVPESPDGREIDEFDAHAFLVCVENDIGDLIGTIRVIDGDVKWLADAFFVDTLPQGSAPIKKRSSVEVSRNAISPKYRHISISDSNVTVLDMLLATAVDCSWDLLNKKYILVTATPVMGIVLKRRGGAIDQVGPIVKMEDGCKIASFLLDLEITRDTYKLRHSCMALHEQCISNATDGDKSVASA
jgi:N-acyl-L-homoserine lactone synthetase